MTKVKICGLSTPEAVATAVKAGADYIGFVFAKSKRQVSLEQAHELAKGVTGQTQTVGVFVSPSLKELEEAISQVPLDIVQIHGTFDEDLISKISVPVIRAIQISDGDSQVKSQAGYLLFDAPIAAVVRTLTGNSWLTSRLNRTTLSLVVWLWIMWQRPRKPSIPMPWMCPQV